MFFNSWNRMTHRISRAIQATRRPARRQSTCGRTNHPEQLEVRMLPATTFSIGDVSVAESAGTAKFTVSLSAGSTTAVKVNYATADATAKAGSDYTTKTGTLTFAPGVLSQTITVAVRQDTLDEIDETFLVKLSSPSSPVTLAKAQGTGTIKDDDATPSLKINDVNVTEGTGNTVNALFKVSLSAASGQTVSVNCTTASKTAIAPNDYTGTGLKLFFAPGEISKTFTVPIMGDTTDEPNETFNVNLALPSNATIADAQGLGTILDNDLPPKISIGDTNVVEGTGTVSNAVFNISLSQASGLPVIANYTMPTSSDYTSKPGTVTFNPGETTKSITVPIVSDSIYELDTTFDVTLNGLTAATIGDGVGRGTIRNDDVIPRLSVRGGYHGESDGQILFQVVLKGKSEFPVNASFFTTDGTAKAGQDYLASKVTLPPFQPSVNDVQIQYVSVKILNDSKDEADDETLFGHLTTDGVNVIMTEADAVDVAHILDDDNPPTVSISNDFSVTEGTGRPNTVTLTVSLSAPSGKTVSVFYDNLVPVALPALPAATAASPSDYTLLSTGVLTFDPGVTTRTIQVSINPDSSREFSEFFHVRLSGVQNATLARKAARVTILDDDNLVFGL